MDVASAVEPVRQRLAEATAGTEQRLSVLQGELARLREQRSRAAAAAAVELAEFARGEAALPELRAAQRRVDRGDLTWERVALGEAGLVGELLGDSLERLPRAFTVARELIDSGVTPEEAVRRVAIDLDPDAGGGAAGRGHGMAQ